jgi:hypothetical protein
MICDDCFNGSINIKNSIESDELAKSYGDFSVFLNESIKDRCTFTVLI